LICAEHPDCEPSDEFSLGKCCLEAGAQGQPCMLDHGCIDAALTCAMVDDINGNIWNQCDKVQSD
jgi:hypothetical protein